MERTVMTALLSWKNRKNRKPLVITGVRQCGKTYVIKEFGRIYYEDMAYINLEKSDIAKAVFDADYDPVRIISELGTLFLGHQIVPEKTLLVLDEIQDCPRAITSLKYFCEELPQLHVVCAGSLLGVELKRQGISFPVGKIDRINMRPMSFEEFVRADGGAKYLDVLSDRDISGGLNEALTEPLIKYYKNYLIVGGMPEVVQSWVNDHDYEEVDLIQENILADYRDDFSKHADPSVVPKITAVWDSIPKQTAEDNTKFMFSHVKQSGRAKELEGALQWILDAGLAYKLERVEKVQLPLDNAADASVYKVYMADCGLLRRKSGLSVKSIITGDTLFERFRGALAENYVLTELLNLNLSPYYWTSGNTAEVDFITSFDDNLLPVEVKSADNTKAKSLSLFCKRYSVKRAFKLSLKNSAINRNDSTELISLPLYMIWNMLRYF